MKKIIAAALSILVGAFGYTIVDSTIENRVSRLESEVYELREEVSGYHFNTQSGEPIFSEKVTDILVVTPPHGSYSYLFATTTKPIVADNSFRVGKTITINNDSRTKFLIRINHDGYVEYISPEDYNPETTEKNPSPTTVQSSQDLNDPRETTTSGYRSSVVPGDYFLCINNTSAVVSAIVESSTSYYDKDYSLVVQPICEEFEFTITYSGQTDPALAGERLEFTPNINSIYNGRYAYYRLKTRSNNVVKNDGSFKFDETYVVMKTPLISTTSWMSILNSRMSYEIYSVELSSKT